MSVDINRILNELESLPDYKEQISLQTVPGKYDPSYGTGRLDQLADSEEEFVVPIFEQLTYTNSVIESFGMYRTRVMKMKAKSCYTYHQDPTIRMHIPLITNDDCFFVIEDQVVRCPADGNTYVIDTRKKHTFVNASRQERIHIVGCV